MEARSLRSARRRRGEFHDVDVQNQPFPKPLKDFCIETDLSGQVWVVPPDEEGGKALADRVVGALGKGAATRIASEVTEADCADAEIVVLGNVHNNDLMRRLGMDFYLWTDHYFPGGDGYEVRTVHNPFGSGRNVVQLGGSTIEGAGRAADAFLGILDTNGTRLSRINQVVSDRIPKQPPSDDQVRENIDRINESIAISGGQGPLRQMVQNGLMYYLTGHDGYGQMFREEFLFFIDLVEEVGTWALAKGTNVYFWGYRMFTAWDVLEEGDVLSDADRLKMTTGLYNILRWVSAMTHFRYDAPDEIVQHQNHQSFAASTLYTGARYFKKYYGLKTYDQKLPYAQRILELHARSYKPNDNAGTGYIWLTPSHVIKYGMLSGDFSFLENGHLARLLDSAVLTIDSLGDECTYGDVGGYSGGRSRRPAGLNAAAIGAWSIRIFGRCQTPLWKKM